MRTRAGLLLYVLVVPFTSQAQTPEPGPAKPAQSSQPGSTSKDRLFFALPNFLTLENADQAPPLTGREKFTVTLRSSFDPVQFVWYGLFAGISQAENSDRGYHQGGAGYARRYGASFADGTIESLTTEAILPSLLHQDPRYFQAAKSGFWWRTGYALSRIFLTRSDSGQTQFNYSEILGSASAAGISTFSYHPHGDRNLSNALSVWRSQLGFGGFKQLNPVA